ncbi:MAG TPA: SPOR domain-containing protein [archaeon]|nr:SPOR domain-containing protein [archaeon]
MKRSGLAAIVSKTIAAMLFIAVRALPVCGQDMLEVVKTQMALGLTSDARVLVESALESAAPGGTGEKALFYQAVLTAGGDSAFQRLQKVAGSGQLEGWAVTGDALERLGDLAFAKSGYPDAVKYWQLAGQGEKDLETGQRLLVKTARAELRNNKPQAALSALRKALELGQSPQTGMIRYWRGVAKQAAGDQEGAVNEYMVTYNRAGDPYQFTALYRLAEIYGQGGSGTAGEWRKRWQDTSSKTVFDTRILTPREGPSYSIQLGAFSTSERAKAFAEKAGKLGLEPVVLPAGADGLYRVRIQGLVSRKELDRVVSILKKNRLEYRIISPGG